MTPMVAQAAEIAGGGPPTPRCLHFIFVAPGFGFLLSVFIGVRAVKLRHWARTPADTPANEWRRGSRFATERRRNTGG